jgi:hypothetical protein
MKIKVFQFPGNPSFNVEDIEKKISAFIEGKEVIDIKVAGVTQSVSICGHYSNKTSGTNTVVYTILYKESNTGENSL